MPPPAPRLPNKHNVLESIVQGPGTAAGTAKRRAGSPFPCRRPGPAGFLPGREAAKTPCLVSLEACGVAARLQGVMGKIWPEFDKQELSFP